MNPYVSPAAPLSSLPNLLDVKDFLRRSFAVFVTVFVLRLLFNLFAIGNVSRYDHASVRAYLTVFWGLTLILLVAYTAFSLAIVRAARALSKDPARYVAYLLGAPIVGLFIALVPRIPLAGLIMHLLLGSPIVVFLTLSGELDGEIAEASALR